MRKTGFLKVGATAGQKLKSSTTFEKVTSNDIAVKDPCIINVARVRRVCGKELISGFQCWKIWRYRRRILRLEKCPSRKLRSSEDSFDGLVIVSDVCCRIRGYVVMGQK